MKHTYKKIINYVKPNKMLLLFSLLSSLLYVIMNSASIWIIGSLISKIMIPNHINSHPSITNSTSINMKLNDFTNQIIGNGDSIIQLKSICILLLFIYIFKNIFFYFNNLSISFIQNKIIKDKKLGMVSFVLIILPKPLPRLTIINTAGIMPIKVPR